MDKDITPDRSTGFYIEKLEERPQHWAILVEYGSSRSNTPWQHGTYRGLLLCRKDYALSVM